MNIRNVEEEINEKNLILISQMASMHNISRQTLIHYDNIDLFKPVFINHKGYRYYSLEQIPYLREICLMKNLGFSLQEIKDQFSDRNVKTAYDLMNNKLAILDEEIKVLVQKKIYIEQRRNTLKHISTKVKNINTPYIEWKEQRKAFFVPFEDKKVEKGQLHLTLMKAWNISEKNQIVPSSGFGALIKYDSVCQGNPLKAGGSILNIHINNLEKNIENLYTIPEGEYVIMYKYGMPYDTEPLNRLLIWIKEHGYEVAGDIIDLCILDTTFYDSSHNADFCCLQIPIK